MQQASDGIGKLEQLWQIESASGATGPPGSASTAARGAGASCEAQQMDGFESLRIASPAVRFHALGTRAASSASGRRTVAATRRSTATSDLSKLSLEPTTNYDSRFASGAILYQTGPQAVQ